MRSTQRRTGETLQVYISGIIVGIILLQTVVFAPTIFKALDIAVAGPLLRSLFPKFFVFLAVLGFLQLGVLALESSTSVFAWSVSGISFLFPAICRGLIPATNKARDDGNDGKFKRLHRWSVLLTMLVLLGNLAMPWMACASVPSGECGSEPEITAQLDEKGLRSVENRSAFDLQTVVV